MALTNSQLVAYKLKRIQPLIAQLFDVDKTKNPLKGRGYVLSEALYHMLGGKAFGWTPMQLRHEGVSHWFLLHRGSGTILDVTASPFMTPVPYEKARGRGFLTKSLCGRTRRLIEMALA